MNKIKDKDIIKVEGNICEYPFFTFSKSEGKIEKKEYFFNPIILEDGKIEERTLTLEIIKGWGLPTAFDMDVLITISQIATETNSLTGKIHFTLYDIAKRLGIYNKEVRIRESILRMYYVNCHSQYCILIVDKKGKKKRYLNNKDYFHIFDHVGLLDVKQEKNNRKSRELTYVRFNKFFMKNFFSGYFQYIDFKTYLDLGTPTSKRLYIYLSKKRSGRSSFKISITKLANIIPIESKELFNIRKLLKKSCKSLKDKNIISDYKLEKRAMDITFYFHENEKIRLTSKTDKNKLDLSDEKISAYKQLTKIGVSKGISKKLLNEFSLENIIKQIEWLSYRKTIDPAALLVTSIKQNWAPPKEVIEQKEQKENQGQIETLKKILKDSKYIVFPSGNRCEIIRVLDEALEILDKEEIKIILLKNVLNCGFE